MLLRIQHSFLRNSFALRRLSVPRRYPGEIDGWSKHTHKESGLPYWYNSDSEETTWNNPFDQKKTPKQPRRIYEVIYQSAFDSGVKSLKAVSVTSCACTLLASPAIIAFGDDSLPIGARCFLAIALSSFGIFSTGVVHWITKPHISKLAITPNDSSDNSNKEDDFLLEVTTRSLFGFSKKQIFSAKELRPKGNTVHPFANFSTTNKDHFHIKIEDIKDEELQEVFEDVTMSIEERKLQSN
eukprot:g188.t1